MPDRVPPAFPPDHYLNRELSWLEFNARVLEEAADPSNPWLERLKFLAIFSSNLETTRSSPASRAVAWSACDWTT